MRDTETPRGHRDALVRAKRPDRQRARQDAASSIEARLDLRDNALNVLRIALATLVIVSHAFPIAGYGVDPQVGGFTLGTFAVGGFFVISGYLIAGSGYRTPFGRFVWRRVLRIIPGFWVCMIFTAFGAAYLGGVVRGGWSVHAAGEYALSTGRMFFGSTNSVGGTLIGAPFPGQWNGSVWTLRYEMLCYLGLGIALLIGYIRRTRWTHVAAFVLATVGSLVTQNLGITNPIGETLLLVPFFLAGVVIYQFADRIPLTGGGAAAAAGLVVVFSVLGQGRSLTALPLAYLLLWIGVVLPRRMRRLWSKNDFSYGMYLYAFPVQQLLVLAGANALGAPVFIVLSVLATTPFAVASWFAVEHPAQKLKNWKPFVHRTSVVDRETSVP